MASGEPTTKVTHYEILMNISDDNLLVLANMYKREKGVPYASLALTCGRKIRMEKKYSLIRFMSVGNRWRDDGNFFILLEIHNRYEMALFTLDSLGRRIYEGLMKTKRIHFGRPIIMTAVHRNIYPIVMRVLDERNLNVASNSAQYIYCLPIEEAYKYEITCPEDYELKQLEPHHAEQIDSLWTKKFKDSKTYLEIILGLIASWGVFKKSNDQLISWAVRMPLGYIGIVHTLKQYQKKTFGSLVVQKISRVIAAEDENPIAFVPIAEERAQAFFEKLGFENVGTENTIELEKVDLKVKPSVPSVSSYEFDDYERYTGGGSSNNSNIRESAL